MAAPTALRPTGLLAPSEPFPLFYKKEVPSGLTSQSLAAPGAPLFPDPLFPTGASQPQTAPFYSNLPYMFEARRSVGEEMEKYGLFVGIASPFPLQLTS